MDKIIIKGVPPLDGEYTIDLVEMITFGSTSYITMEEAHQMKVRTGILLPEMEEAISKGDPDAQFGLVEIALARLGKPHAGDLLWKAPVGAVVVDIAKRETEVDAGPPEVTPSVSSPTSEQLRSGGESLSPTLEPSPVSEPSRIGPPGSERSATLGLVTSGF